MTPAELASRVRFLINVRRIVRAALDRIARDPAFKRRGRS
jgi:hypothetical protein